MANRQKGIGIIVTHNTEQEQVVLPPTPSPAISKRLDRFDVHLNTWSQRSEMNDARCGFALHAYSDFLYAIGGTDGAQIHKSAEEYDISTDTWTIKSDMTTPRAFFQSVEHNGYIYCIGGVTSNAFGATSATRSVERYDTINDAWEAMADLPANYAILMGVAQVVDDKIYVLSGYKNGFADLNDRAAVYDIATNTWTVEGALTDSELSVYYRILPFSFVENGYIYVLSGLYYEQPEPLRDDDGDVTKTFPPIINFLPDTYRYEIATGVVDRGDRDFIDLPRARYAGAVATIGSIHYFLGGSSNISNTLRFLETVDVTTSPYTYSDFARMNKGRSSFGADVYIGEYGDAIWVSGGTMSKQDENFLRVVVDAIPKRIKLDGKQSCSVRIRVMDENGEAPSEVTVRLVGRGGPDNIVLFTFDDIVVKNGYAVATLLPRADDSNGEVTMNNDTVRSYSVSISGSVIDGQFYGDTEPVAVEPDNDGGGIETSGGGGVFSKPTLPGIFGNPIVFDTVISAEQTTPGSNLNVSNLGGFLTLRSSLSAGGVGTGVEFYSDIRWLPRVVSIIETNEGDYALLRDHLDRLSREDPFGGSPIMDALVRSAEILDFDVTGVRRLMYIMTDGQENCSHNSAADVLAVTNALSGVGKTPIISSLFRVIPSHLYLDQGVRSGSTAMEDIAKQTNASAIYVATDAEVEESIRTLLNAKGFIGHGLFTFNIDLGDEVVIESIRANFDLLDPETDGYWRYSIGREDGKYTLLTDRFEANETVELTNTFGRYLRFAVEFSASLNWGEYNAEKLVPPRFTSLEIVYHKKTESYIYLNPTDTLEDPHQIIVTLDVTRPLGSEILIGAHDSQTGSWEDYNSPSAPAVENDSRIVLPIRKSLDTTTYTLEALKPVDGFIFETTYGKWNQDAKVIVYRDGTYIVPEEQYKLIPHKGRVIFSHKTTDSYVVSIENKPKLSIAAKIVNRVHGTPVLISGAGYMYSTVKKEGFSISRERLVPEAANLLITPLQTNVDSVFRANYLYNDLKGREEKDSIITWYINDEVDADIQDLAEWDNKDFDIVKPGDIVYFTIEPGAKNGDIVLYGRKVRSLPVTVG